jgi:hypothetical protein
MRARSIKPGFFKNEQLIELPFEYRLLFAGLWGMADREGRLEDRPKKVKLDVFPGDNVDCEKGISALAERGFLLRYSSENINYIQILAWKKHQSPHIHEGASTIPAPCLNGTGTVQAPYKKSASTRRGQPFPASAALTPDSGLLTPDSGLLTPDSGLLTPDSGSPPTPPAGAETVFDHWKKVWDHPRAYLDRKRRKRIEARLKEFNVEQLCDAISGFKNSQWHCGTDPKGDGKTYDGIDTLLRDTAQVETGMRLLAHPPKQPKKENATERIMRALAGTDDSRVIDHESDLIAKNH